MGALQLAARTFAHVPELIAIHASEQAQKCAIVQGSTTISYHELNATTGRIAAALQRDGVTQGRSVAIVSATTVQATLIFLGAIKAGCVPAPIAPSGSAEQILAMIKDSAAAVVLVDAEAKALLPALDIQFDIQVVDLERLESWLPAEGVEPAPVTIEPQHSFNIIYSSGTTGVPKGIVHTHGMRWAQISGYGVAQFDQAVTLVATPLYSNSTLISLLPTLAYGGTAVLLGKFDAHEFLAEAQRLQATHTMLVPVQYQRIMNLPDFDTFDLTSFRFKSCTSAPFSEQLKREVVRRWPGLLVEVYGMTEGGGTCLLMANQFPAKLHTVGRPAPGCDICLIDEQGNEVAAGEVGEVVGRSAAMMSGYHGQADTTRKAIWTDGQGRQYFRHGDLGRFDDDGFLILLGRSKDMIISGGFNVYPPDIEAVIRQHPEIDDCAVIGVPSSAWGETPYAFFVGKTNSFSVDEVVSWVNGRVGKTQRLSGAQAIDQLPLSAIGKVLKRELRDRFHSEYPFLSVSLY
ncbi:class I adenylate-forming enzyme family protein [Pseudomonas sp. Z18(2022)]|uniref:class I adenylate-forming enzyme family protein n=1 Tax=Pseudomonas sp. Z18(2022) TaxID=2983410 RepID=UPI002E81D601|nr:class I adenylate-forming enzyme family protein [Pseudomonas sp. Z18(2022)]